MAETRRFLLHVHLHHFGIDRLAALMPKFQSRIEGMAFNKDFKIAYRNSTGEVFGYFLRSSLKATQIRARLANEPEGWMVHDPQPGREPLIRDKDLALVVELGDDFDAKLCPSTVGTWLKLHH